MATRKKMLSSVVAVATAATLLLGGTLAWQSISQEATNIVTAEVNPGGRLHDDFDGSNDKNIYVENFGTQNIYARVKLSEYLEIGPNAGDTGFADRQTYLENEDIKVLAGAENVGDNNLGLTEKYTTYFYEGDNASDEYWTKDWGGSTIYVPTFNKNQDSLAPDLNGTYDYENNEGINVPYGDFVTYTDGQEVPGNEIVDNDTNDVDEDINGAGYAEGDNIITTATTHTALSTPDTTVISIAEWYAEYVDYDDETGEEIVTPFEGWVYDEDGWAYWGAPIAPGTATGLLLTAINDQGLIDEDYYYAIHVTGQFITAGDLGKDNSTGFYTNDAEAPTDDALLLLAGIGVKTEVEEGDEGGEEVTEPFYYDVYINEEYTSFATFVVGEESSFVIGVEGYDENDALQDLASLTWSVLDNAEGTTLDESTEDIMWGSSDTVVERNNATFNIGVNQADAVTVTVSYVYNEETYTKDIVFTPEGAIL